MEQMEQQCVPTAWNLGHSLKATLKLCWKSVNFVNHNGLRQWPAGGSCRGELGSSVMLELWRKKDDNEDGNKSSQHVQALISSSVPYLHPTPAAS
jgi:hypothetical protein